LPIWYISPRFGLLYQEKSGNPVWNTKRAAANRFGATFHHRLTNYRPSKCRHPNCIKEMYADTTYYHQTRIYIDT
jgi:hypothetical protein